MSFESARVKEQSVFLLYVKNCVHKFLLIQKLQAFRVLVNSVLLKDYLTIVYSLMSLLL